MADAAGEAAAVSAASATERILRAAIAELVSRGAGALAMHDVAERAGVSKGLIHYHYQDKDALLARAAERLGARIAMRASRALASSSPATVVEDLRRWLQTELDLGEWHALLALGEWPASSVQAASREALEARRAVTARMTQQLFELLGVRPRIALKHAADLLVALVGGLAVEPESDADPLAAFDVLVLALLGLAE